jgi:hypothetical protein
MAKCRLCEGVLSSTTAGKDAQVCAIKSVVRPASCWMNGPDQGKAMCAKSLVFVPTLRFEDRAAAFKQIGEVIDRTPLHVRNALMALTQAQRFELMRWASPELKLRLSPLLVDLQVEKLERPPSTASVPDDLPDHLRQGLVEYAERLDRRQERLLKNGHVRSPRYLKKLMQNPIRLARHLASEGITSWEGMRKRDLVGFLAANPKVPPTSLSRFLRALAEDKPFRDRRGRGPGGKKKGGVQPKPLQEVMSPEELNQTLDEIRATWSEAEYAMAWLICKMGQTAKAAHRFTVDRLKIDDAGRLVMRAADVWVVVPKSAAKVFSKLADEAAPGWRNASGNELEFIRLFERQIANLDDFRAEVLGGQARKLRASCVYAAMLKGNLDRVTINQTMGVSIATITSIERHLSSDVHRKLSPELVEERNKVLKGEASV